VVSPNGIGDGQLAVSALDSRAPIEHSQIKAVPTINVLKDIRNIPRSFSELVPQFACK
jgi:hypothetical protein